MLVSPFAVGLHSWSTALANIVIIGIALFTYHKYRKTVDSNVALDEHGNVIYFNGENLSGEGSVYDRGVELIASPYDARPIRSSVSWLKKGVV